MKILLLVDIQNDFCPGGALAVPQGDKIVPVVNRLMASGEYDLIVASQDWHPVNHSTFITQHPGKAVFDQIDLKGHTETLWPEHCVANTPGAEFHPDLRVDLIDHVVKKGTKVELDSHSAFIENDQVTSTGMHEYITKIANQRGIDPCEIELTVAGLAFDICVAYTIRDAKRLGYHQVIPLDARRLLSPEGEAAFLAELDRMEIEVTTAEKLIPSERERGPAIEINQQRA